MSLMSAAEAGDTADTSPVIARRGLRMARPAAGESGTEQGASTGERFAAAGPSGSAGQDGQPRLAAGQLRVTRVRVARQVSVRTLRTGGSRASTRPADTPRASARAASTRRASVPRASVRAASVRRASMQAASMQAVSMPPGSVRAARGSRVSVQAASLQRASVQAVRVARPAGQARPGGLRLTRRGRRVVAVFAMLMAIVAATLIWASAAGGARTSGHDLQPSSGYRGMTEIVVRPGQTLWSIAAAAEPSANPWTVVQQIIDANALSGTQVRAGQLLWVPKG